MIGNGRNVLWLDAVARWCEHWALNRKHQMTYFSNLVFTSVATVDDAEPNIGWLLFDLLRCQYSIVNSFALDMFLY